MLKDPQEVLDLVLDLIYQLEDKMGVIEDEDKRFELTDCMFTYLAKTYKTR